MLFHDFYLRITKLTENIIKSCEQEDYDVANNLLSQRLTLLKTLAAKAAVIDEQSPEKQQYYAYLRNLKEQDDLQMSKLSELRLLEVKRHGEQKHKNKAISLYKKFT